ncbi:hypothetical protein BDW75DRAFT_197105 [Aspergillus navahoensis]
MNEPPATEASSNPLMCVAVGTVRREGDSYLDASVGSLLAGLHPKERSAFLVNVLFANTEPRMHPNWR